MAATIKDIANAAGVSRGTVDRVLHDRGGVKPEIAEKIRSLANEMGFIPNRAGKMLAARKQPLKIGCLLFTVGGNVFFDDVIKGFKIAEKNLSDYGVSVVIKTVSDFEVESNLEKINELVSEGCCGLCLATVDVVEIRQKINELVESGIPVITVNTDVSNSKRLCYVGSDYSRSGHVAAGMTSLICKEKLKILLVTGSLKIKGHNDRILGFMQGLSETSVQYDVIAKIESHDSDDYAFEATTDSLRMYPEINMIFVSAAGACGVWKAVKNAGLTDKIKMLTFDDTPAVVSMLRQHIIDFTVCQDPVEQGVQSVMLMFSYFMENKKNSPQNYITKNSIKIRENL